MGALSVNSESAITATSPGGIWHRPGHRDHPGRHVGRAADAEFTYDPVPVISHPRQRRRA